MGLQTGLVSTGLYPGVVVGKLAVPDLSLFVLLFLVVDLTEARVQQEIH